MALAVHYIIQVLPINNTTGTVIVEVQHDAPDVLYYQCASHANMKGTIYVTGALADDGVTTAKLAR